MEGVILMIAFIILLSLVVSLAVAALVSAIVAGIGFTAVFGDLIVFGLIIWLIIKIFRKKKEK